MGGDLHELVNEFSAAFRILKVGWSLFDQRCTAKLGFGRGGLAELIGRRAAAFAERYFRASTGAV